MVYDMGSSSMDQIQSNDRPVWDMPPGDVARRPAARKWRNLDRSERTNGGRNAAEKARGRNDIRENRQIWTPN